MEKIRGRSLQEWKEYCSSENVPVKTMKYIICLEERIAAISVTRCCEEFADGKCKPMVNADWTYLRCECGKRFEPKG